MPFKIVRQDITKMKVDAIVNAANTELKMGGGVCGAIFKAAGITQLQTACDELAPIKTGEAVITPGFNLPAKFIIHTAGPIYKECDEEENEHLLRLSYINSLNIAVENNLNSIAFPLISSGIYGYPKEEALRVAISAIRDFLTNYDLEVTLVVFDKSAFTMSNELLESVESYIDEHYVDTHEIKRERMLEEANTYSPLEKASVSLNEFVFNLDESFSQTLLRLIDIKGMSDVEVYKRANLDRKLFSKIRSKIDYSPSKRTAIALAIGLKLSIEETDEFLESAGYTLSHAIKFDVIIEYFIVNSNYDIFAINEVLFAYDQPLL
ncbi:macro domain-containing protein [Aerococcaceae bacterium DSM 111176]|nr:macro domain-containing protein [Aerococcaceae bacterium DSM 111176]